MRYSFEMPLNHYVTLGRSGLRVSPFCLGAMTFGEEWGWGASVPESEAIIARYLELGGNFIDTANGYTRGHSETIIGNFIVGFDTDTRGVFAQTLDFVQKTGIVYPFFSILTPMPGTALFDEMKAAGRLDHERWDLYDTRHVVFEPRNMTRDELHSQNLGSILTALVWVVPIVLSSRFNTQDIRLELWAVVAVLVMTVAVALPSAPMGTLLFTWLVGGASVIAFGLTGAWPMAIVALLFTIIASFFLLLVVGAVAPALAESPRFPGVSVACHLHAEPASTEPAARA